jgi:hypothetical protein
METQAENGLSATENAGKVDNDNEVKQSQDKIENAENETVAENGKNEDTKSDVEDDLEDNVKKSYEKDKDEPVEEVVSEEAKVNSEETELNRENLDNEEKENAGIFHYINYYRIN